jgi:3-oxoacyl-(acyl-carrier-protein) synthase
MRKVVITGIGLRTPIGNTFADAQSVFRSGKPVIRSVIGPKGQVRAGAFVDADISGGFSRAEMALLDPVAQMALVAADDCVADSGADFNSFDRDRVGVFVGTGQGTVHTSSQEFGNLALKDSVKAFSVLRGLGNGAGNFMAIRHKLRGPCETTMLACSSANTALGHALRAIQYGHVDAALAGGVEATFCEGSWRIWEAMRVLAKVDADSPETSCRPFSADRTGLVLGEGAVIYMLEAEEHARARGAKIYAVLAGFGASCDGSHISQPDASGQVLALNACLKDAQLTPPEVGYVNAHGTATPTGDPVEAQALRVAFGSHANALMVSSTKSLHGHLLGAAGAIELLAAISAVRDGLIAPTANLHTLDPACDLDFVPLHSRQADVQVAVSSNFAFGGSNACIAVTRA